MNDAFRSACPALSTAGAANGAAQPIRLLFVLAWLGMDGAQAEVRRLAIALPRDRYRIEVFPCFQQEGAPAQSHEQLQALDVAVDTAAYALGFEETVAHLRVKLARCDVVISCQNVADIYPALEGMHLRPPLIEYGRMVNEAMAGPKHFTTRYVGASASVRAAAASRMPGREHDAIEISPAVDHIESDRSRCDRTSKAPGIRAQGIQTNDAVYRWQGLFESVLETRVPAPAPVQFAGVLLGGWECSTHRLRCGRRLDMIAATDHDVHAAADYRQLREFGVRACRDGVRWHLVERSHGQYDFASITAQFEAARETRMPVIWDLMHYGWPDGLDIWSPAFVDRFARYSRAVALHLKQVSDAVPYWCPINEISYLAWAGAEVGYMNPFARGRSFELKVQLARAAVAAMAELRAVDPRARFVHAEPLIAVHPVTNDDRCIAEAQAFHEAQFQAFDLIAGRMWPQIGGDPSWLDLLGLNYYPNNQWFHGGGEIPLGHARRTPLSDLMFDVAARYGRPMLIAETGAEGNRRASWFEYVWNETMRARTRGVPVEGLCLYPIADRPDWDDGRPLENGLLSATLGRHGSRDSNPELLRSLKRCAGTDRS